MLITPIRPHTSLNNIVPIKKRSAVSSMPNCLGCKDNTLMKKLTRKPVGARRGTLSNVRKKVLLEQKLEETIRKNKDKKLQNIEEHKDDLIQRKQMLADILHEYEQITKDKNILTAEIRNMKKYLADIRSKLDQSMSVLNKNTTLFALKRGLSKHKRSTSKVCPKAKHTKSTKKSDKSKAIPTALDLLSSFKF